MAKILVVDNDDQARLLATTILSRGGYRVEEARDGREALEVLSRGAPDVLLTSIVMPKKEGLQLIREVRDLYPEVWIIAMCGEETKYPGLHLESARQFGAVKVIYKPDLSDELLRAVEIICDGMGAEVQE